MKNSEIMALSTEFPDNRIVLINGSELVCYPKVVQPKFYNEDNVSLDKSGKFLAIGSKPVVKTKTTDKDELRDFFCKNAFLFYRNAHRILNDSRMFLAPVPVQNGLMYTGTSGFRRPTLGVYVEWWLNCEATINKDKAGKDALTYYFVGSPFSGSHKCSCVYPDGEIAGISHSPFLEVWSSFMNINSRYTKAKQKYEAYTLPEVVELLLAAGESRESELETQLDIAVGHGNKLKTSFSHLKEQYDKLHAQYNNLIIRHYKHELDEFRTEYHARKQKAEQEIESFRKAKADLKSQMKQGKIDNVEYQHAITPLAKRKRMVEHDLITFRTKKTVALVNKGHITFAQIDNYIDQ